MDQINTELEDLTKEDQEVIKKLHTAMKFRYGEDTLKHPPNFHPALAKKLLADLREAISRDIKGEKNLSKIIDEQDNTIRKIRSQIIRNNIRLDESPQNGCYYFLNRFSTYIKASYHLVLIIFIFCIFVVCLIIYRKFS